MVLLWSFFKKTEQRKAFYIIPNYRQKCGWLRWNATKWRGIARFALAFDYNFDYVICCGIKASDKLRTSVGENVFFIRRAGYLIQKCSRWTFIGLDDID